MGEYAEYELARWMRYGQREPKRKKQWRNPVLAHCPYCDKGIRPIAGNIEESMTAHIKAKHKAKETT